MDSIVRSDGGANDEPWLDWGVAQRPKSGETVSGDHYVVKHLPDRTFVAVIDGLGHGRAAAEAAHIAGTILEIRARDPLDALVRQCHEALQGTRGAVMVVAMFDARTHVMQWLNIGNVEGLVLHPHETDRARIEHMLARPGIVGYRLPALAISTVLLRHGDIVIMATDGIDLLHGDRLRTITPPQPLAHHILTQFGTADDDALVLVAHYRGVTP